MSFSSILKENRKSVIGAGILSCVPLLFSSWATSLLIQNQADLSALSAGQWTSFFALSALTMALALTPSTFIALVAGFFLGWKAVPFMLPAYLLASALGYLAGLVLDGGHLMHTIRNSPRVKKALETLNTNSWSLMFLVRLSPVLPFALMNLLMPALKVRFSVFLLGGFLGMLPRTLFSIWLGKKAQDMVSLLNGEVSGSESTWLVMVLVVVSAGGLFYLFNRALKQALTD
ncbi:TVP38/TMEM64 family protein [Endozoicomonas arenosclerae]|uniref:TVP38/TMEM64 family protein n=1 Tax=Endozoicomonas arenosclerae TaxID=1633495 RepID=UPI0007803466|nr:VTT domain-containing protein [Endozoicomonas arenosclerae]